MEAAKKMGLTQAAISHYLRSKRGTKAYSILKRNEKLRKILDEIADIVYNEGMILNAFSQICQICKIIRENKELFSSLFPKGEELIYPL